MINICFFFISFIELLWVGKFAIDKREAAAIHPKRRNLRKWNSADNLNFLQRDCLRTRNVSRLYCLQSYWWSFPLFIFSHCNKLSIKTLKHTIFSMKIPHWHQILVIFMIYALLSRNFDVRIYALFPQIFGNWKVDSADFFTFRMYAVDISHLPKWPSLWRWYWYTGKKIYF